MIALSINKRNTKLAKTILVFHRLEPVVVIRVVIDFSWKGNPSSIWWDLFLNAHQLLEGCRLTLIIFSIPNEGHDYNVAIYWQIRYYKILNIYILNTKF